EDRQKALGFAPAGLGKGRRRQRAVEERRQRGKGLRRRYRLGTEAAGKRIARLGPLGEITGVLDRSPGDRQRRPALRPALPRQRFEREIGGDIDTLPRRAKQRRRRREQEEKLDRVV